MEHASNQDKSAFATEPVGRLIVKFAIPCVISLVVNALYNIVDQILLAGGSDIWETVRQTSSFPSPSLPSHLPCSSVTAVLLI